MEAHATLLCTLLRATPRPARLLGMTEVIARDSMTVSVPGDAPPALPGASVTLWVELPSEPGVKPRALRCLATVRTIQRRSGAWRAVLDVAEMKFVRRSGMAA